MFGGGFPFGFSGRGNDSDDEEPRAGVDNEEYYKELEIQKNATQDQIKKAYLRLAKVHHPDRKGGNAEKFHKIGEAYQTLKDEQKRKMYDRFGKKGAEMGGGGGDDLLSAFFGGGRQRASKQQQKVQATKKALNITLQQIYNGELLKIPHKRTRCCEDCRGKGGKNVEKCKACKGQGRVMQMYQMGPGMYQQVQKACDKCSGEGQLIGEGGKCKVCKGKKILEKQKIIEVAVDKGMPHNSPIKMSGEGNQIPDAIAGDLIFITQEQPHDVFERKGADLFMKKNITLLEALTGFEFQLKHLDGVLHNIYTAKGEVISDEGKKIVRGLGMPFHNDPMSHGNLVIQFHVLMPKRGEISKQNIEALINILPGTVNKRPDEDYEMLEEFDPENINTNQQGGKKPEDQYDEDQEQGGVGCSQH